MQGCAHAACSLQSTASASSPLHARTTYHIIIIIIIIIIKEYDKRYIAEAMYDSAQTAPS
jgi:hypothetical protein